MEKPRTRGPSIEKTQETRHKILEAALHHFIQEGFARSKISEIAKRAELGKGTIYSYFETKEQLFEGVIDDFLNESFRPIKAHEIQDHETVYDFICRQIVPSVLTLESTGRADMALLILREGQNFPSILNTYCQKIFFPIQHELQQLVELAISRNELPAQTSAKQFALLIVSPMWTGMIHNRILNPNDVLELDCLFKDNLKLLFNADH